jgi:hypothetical protein
MHFLLGFLSGNTSIQYKLKINHSFIRSIVSASKHRKLLSLVPIVFKKGQNKQFDTVSFGFSILGNTIIQLKLEIKDSIILEYHYVFSVCIILKAAEKYRRHLQKKIIKFVIQMHALKTFVIVAQIFQKKSK